MSLHNRQYVRDIAVGGLLAGTIDIAAACLINGLSPIVILHAIASGILGSASFRSGTSSAVLGLILQWLMSLIIAAVFVIGATWFPLLRRRWMAAGLVYGIVIFFVMNYVVVPLSAVGHRFSFTPVKFLENMLAMLLFGIIIAYAARERTFVLARESAG
jgi:uncharacterized membrane protein YagU involved in acid resistance